MSKKCDGWLVGVWDGKNLVPSIYHLILMGIHQEFRPILLNKVLLYWPRVIQYKKKTPEGYYKCLGILDNMITNWFYMHRSECNEACDMIIRVSTFSLTKCCGAKLPTINP